jgi:hypothetical protein
MISSYWLTNAWLLRVDGSRPRVTVALTPVMVVVSIVRFQNAKRHGWPKGCRSHCTGVSQIESSRSPDEIAQLLFPRFVKAENSGQQARHSLGIPATGDGSYPKTED